jgi:hypothetical protein
LKVTFKELSEQFADKFLASSLGKSTHPSVLAANDFARCLFRLRLGKLQIASTDEIDEQSIRFLVDDLVSMLSNTEA